MRKHTQNVFLDAGLFIVMIALIGTGVVLHFVLPPGSRQEIFVGLTRHQWGELHFWIATLFTAFVVIHLWLHIKWISSSYFKKGKRGS
ncbi:DUF4405 domain-containing protein [Gracilimonas sp.]|uniref:DUF4405 domain-containing protein n=1 Tax=Gracilimonas sp. TaxID=1974203 RepID=UPI003751C2DA